MNRFVRINYNNVDLAIIQMDQVETRVLNQVVKRNMKRFPKDFMFQPTENEYKILMSQNVTSSWGGTRKLPYVFTEHGVAALSGLLNSDIAIQANTSIMRAFVTMRRYLMSATLQNQGDGVGEKRDRRVQTVYRIGFKK